MLPNKWSSYDYNYDIIFCISELKDKFRYLTNQTSTKNNIIRKFLGCIIEKFNCFTIVCIENHRSIRKKVLSNWYNL